MCDSRVRRWRPVRSWHSLCPEGCNWTPREAVGIPCSAPVATAPRQQLRAVQRTQSRLKVPIQEMFLFRACPSWPSHTHPMVPRSSYHLLAFVISWGGKLALLLGRFFQLGMQPGFINYIETCTGAQCTKQLYFPVYYFSEFQPKDATILKRILEL